MSPDVTTPSDADLPFSLVAVDYGEPARPRSPADKAALFDAVAGFGGRLLIDATEPQRVYEYVLHLPCRLVVSQFPTRAAIDAFTGSAAFETHIRAALGPDRAIAVFERAFDWKPDLTGEWLEPDKPAVLTPGPVYHVTIAHTKVPEKLPYAHAAWSVLNIHRRWGGYPIVTRTPIETLEGGWSPDRTLLVTRWPCIEAFEAWYLDEPYQQNVKPLRLICGRFSLMVFPDASLD
jgi:uncharacterized protein (DUF1330 family)